MFGINKIYTNQTFKVIVIKDLFQLDLEVFNYDLFCYSGYHLCIIEIPEF